MSKKNTNPRVGTLADNGGPTLTIALLTNSPAIDAADDSAAPDFDQRGMVRPNGPRSDIGAFETSFQPTVSIQVLEGTNALAGVNIAIGSNVVVTTGADGRVSTNLPPGTYTLTPSLAGKAFQPSSVEIQIPPGTNIVFTAVGAFSISGQVLEGEAGLSGATVSADAFTAVTGPDGTYTINGVPAGTYFVFASLAGFRFSAAQEVTVGPNATGVNFYVSNRLFTISGTVLEGTNGLEGVTFQEFASLMTDSNGVFRISNLQPDTYTFTPRKIGTTYGFDPPTRTVVLTTQDVTNVDFQAGMLMASLSIMENGQVSFSVLGQPATNCVEVSSNWSTGK